MAGHTPFMSKVDQTLFVAVDGHEPESVAKILREGKFTPGIVDADGRTPLFALCGKIKTRTASQNRAIAQDLISAGFDLLARDDRGYDACEMAAAYGMHSLARELIKLGANPTAALLVFANWGGSKSLASDALGYMELGADPRGVDSKGRGFLQIAKESWGGSSPEVLALFEAFELSSCLPLATPAPEATKPRL